MISSVNPMSSTSSQVLPVSGLAAFGSGSAGDDLRTVPAIAMTTWFGSSRLSVTAAPRSL
jgi:hypothetical protein